MPRVKNDLSKCSHSWNKIHIIKLSTLLSFLQSVWCCDDDMKTHRKIKMDVVSLIAGMLNPASKGQLNSASRTRPPPHPPNKGPPGSPPSTTRLFYFLPQFQISAMVSHYHTQIICVLNISVLYANMLLSYSSNGKFPQSKSISARATCDELSGQRPTGASASFSGFSSCGAKSSTDAGSSLRHSRDPPHRAAREEAGANRQEQHSGACTHLANVLWCLHPPTHLAGTCSHSCTHLAHALSGPS